jgi:hypothetical protein
MSALDAVIEFTWIWSESSGGECLSPRRKYEKESIDGLSTFFTCPFTGYHFGISFSFVGFLFTVFVT